MSSGSLRRLLASALAVSALTVAACGGDDTPATSPGDHAKSSEPVTLKVGVLPIPTSPRSIWGCTRASSRTRI